MSGEETTRELRIELQSAISEARYARWSRGAKRARHREEIAARDAIILDVIEAINEHGGDLSARLFGDGDHHAKIVGFLEDMHYVVELKDDRIVQID